jgi:hypothetical protein
MEINYKSGANPIKGFPIISGGILMNATATTQPPDVGRRHFFGRLADKLFEVFGPLPHSSAPVHIGMYAGSLLPHESWAPPKVPH